MYRQGKDQPRTGVLYIVAAVAAWLVVIWCQHQQSRRLEASFTELTSMSQLQLQRQAEQARGLEHLQASSRASAEAARTLRVTVQAELAALAKALGEVQTSFEQISKSKRANSAIERARRHADKALGELAGGLVRQPRRVPRVPCLLTHTATTPSVRICTLDPRIDVAQSKLLHDDGALTISKSWPLEQLLKNKAGSLVVDVGAGIGYFALLSAALGARVRAFEEDADMVDLLHTSAGLNTFKHAIAADHGLVTKLSGTGGGGSLLSTSQRGALVPEVGLDQQLAKAGEVFILHLAQPEHALHALEGGHAMLAKQRFVFIFVEFRPALLRRAGGRAGDKDAPQRLLRILDAAGYNIFDDAHAQDGALNPKDFDSFVAGVHEAGLTLFAARTNRQYDDTKQPAA